MLFVFGDSEREQPGLELHEHQREAQSERLAITHLCSHLLALDGVHWKREPPLKRPDPALVNEHVRVHLQLGPRSRIVAVGVLLETPVRGVHVALHRERARVDPSDGQLSHLLDPGHFDLDDVQVAVIDHVGVGVLARRLHCLSKDFSHMARLFLQCTGDLRWGADLE